MDQFRFTALGTQWTLLSDGKPFDKSTEQALLAHTEAFEERFSRFRDGSEANSFRQAKPGSYSVSAQMALMLERADLLRNLTLGGYDPAIAPILERAGYDKTYRFTEDSEAERPRIVQWRLEGGKLAIEGPIGFDFGGMGKGWCIDQVAEVLRKLGYEYFLVDGGGDMYGTSKADGRGFQIALEWPGKPDTAFGTLELKHQGLAVSDSFRRRWGKWHHILDPATQLPIAAVIGAAAVGQTAWDADSATAALFQLPAEEFSQVSKTLAVEYVAFASTGAVHVSAGWTGELFGES